MLRARELLSVFLHNRINFLNANPIFLKKGDT